MANFLNIAESQKALEDNVLKTLSEFEARLARSPPAKVTLSVLSDEFAVFKTHTLSLLKMIREQIATLSKSQDITEMRHRRKYLIFNGIPEQADEDVCVRISSIVTEQLKIPNVTPASFKACYRLGKKSEDRNRPVLVRFVDVSLKSLIWKKKTAFKGTSYAISEFLTPRRQTLFVHARTVLGMRNCWSLDGNIFAKLPNGERVRIETEEDVARLNASRAEQQPAATSTPTPAAEAVNEVEVVPGPSGQSGRSRRAKQVSEY